ncbi:hypothetical protein [Methanocella sp. MCL-LM]|uniref:hypothetical protein n=1 Tax=Methanocella sp. MCL-LM TaxID=3412035 RepID=UPI003C70E540
MSTQIPRLKTALAVTAIVLIVALAGCTSSTGSGDSNASAANETQPMPTATVTATAQPDIAGTQGNVTSWFGSVQDSFGRPFEDVYITLHVMTPTGEAYNMTTRSYAGMPYPGSYVFDNIVLTPGATHAYAVAVGDVGDGVQYYGRTDNISLNKSRISSGFIVVHVPMPDAIKATPEHGTIGVAGRSSLPGSTLITAQLYLNGKQYRRAGQLVNFTSDNNAVAMLPEAFGNSTDREGRATAVLTGVGQGSANVTSYLKIGISRNLSDTCAVQVAW